MLSTSVEEREKENFNVASWKCWNHDKTMIKTMRKVGKNFVGIICEFSLVKNGIRHFQCMVKQKTRFSFWIKGVY